MTDLRRVREMWRQSDVTVRDLPLALAMAAASFLPILEGMGTQVGELPGRRLDALAVVAVMLECLPLAVRRRWTVVCLALVSTGFAIDQLRAYHTLAGTALPIAVLTAGAHLERHRRVMMALLTVGYLALAYGLDRLGSVEQWDGFLTFYLALALAWGIGAWLRTTRRAEADRRRRIADETRTAERTRIARELHDVVTHHVTAMVVQAEAARYLTAAPKRLDDSLAAVSETGRRAITDLRHLLNLLDPGHGEQAGAGSRSVDDLQGLVEQARRTGQQVEFTETGTAAGSVGSAELVAHRVVQEALTNALKHAHGSRTLVAVHHDESEITVLVRTDGSGAPIASSGGSAGAGGSGRGLAGLRARVEMLGGQFDAHRGHDGGFVVQAQIPSGDQV